MPNRETEDPPQSSLLDGIKHVFTDGLDYFQSTLTLIQARMTGMALSAILFIIFLIACGILVMASFVLFTVAVGIWLTKVTGHATYSLGILGAFYALLAIAVGQRAFSWLKKMNL